MARIEKTQQETDARECPFCGGTFIRWLSCAGKFLVHPENSPYERLVCWTCGTGTTPFPPDAFDQCLRLWNTRAHEDGPSRSDWERLKMPKHSHP